MDWTQRDFLSATSSVAPAMGIEVSGLQMLQRAQAHVSQPASQPTMQPDSQPTRRPNIVLIVADDMGFSDIGCYGSEIRTPHLDGLARGGIRFTQVYNAARCCPSRACLLTGLYPHQTGVGHMTGDSGKPGYRGFINDNCVTLAEALRPAGYRTGMSGKWHVGGNYSLPNRAKWSPGAPGFPTPITRGFDRFFGTLAGAGNYYNPYSLMRQDRFIDVGVDEDFYYTDQITDHTVETIEQAVGDGSPFFHYVAYTAPHWPLQAPREDIEKYVGHYRKGWDAIRTARHEQMKAMGLLDPRWEISPRDCNCPPWDGLDDAHRDWQGILMAVYAAQIDRMDQGIGRILACLERLGQADNTLVIFLSDNGGCAEFLREDGYIQINRRPARDGRPAKVGNVFGRIPGDEDVFMSYGLPWSNVSNAPFRRFKSWTHEGGISTPCVVRMPGGPAGAIRHEVIHILDFMPTLLDLAGANYPEQSHASPVLPAEGESFMPLLRGQEWSRQRPLFFEHEGNRAVRMGEWKLVSKFPGKWELYNLTDDRTELHDLAAKDTALVARVEAMYHQWADRCNVLPWEQVRGQ